MGLALPSFFYESSDVDATFGDRFRAWWDGHEVASEGSRDADGNMPDVEADVHAMRPPGTKPVSAPRELWSKERRTIAQMVWGDGFTLPGGEEYVRNLINAFSLTPADSALEFGSALGGGTAAIVGHFGAYLTCYERDADLRADAGARALTLAMDDKVNLVPLQDKLADLRSNFFLGALVREVLCTFDDPEDFLYRIIQALKAEGQLVVADLFFDDEQESPELQAWLEIEPQHYNPTSTEMVQRVLKKNNMVVRTAEDESDEYRATAIAGWVRMLDQLDAKLEPALADALVYEAELWARRIAALDAGVLRYYRFVGIKNG